MSIDKNLFQGVTKIVIDKLEGGYFHPDMRSNRPDIFGSYHRSGETMFGLDRHAGHDLYYKTKRKTKDVLENLKYIYGGAYEYKSPEARKFWQTIDNANARKLWKWNYKGGKYQNELQTLAADILRPQYDKLAKTYLTEESQNLIAKDPRLLFHFIYAVWNGSGWFQRFASKFNQAVKEGKRGDALLNAALNSRINSTNSLISNGGKKIKGFINTIELPKSTSSAGGLLKFILLPILIYGAYSYLKK